MVRTRSTVVTVVTQPNPPVEEEEETAPPPPPPPPRRNRNKQRRTKTPSTPHDVFVAEQRAIYRRDGYLDLSEIVEGENKPRGHINYDIIKEKMKDV